MLPAEVLKANDELGNFFEKAAAGFHNPKAIANWVINGLSAQLAATGTTLADLRFPPGHLRELVELVDSGKISTRIAQEVFTELFATGKAPAAIVERKGLAQVSDTGAIEKICDEVIAANPGKPLDFVVIRAGQFEQVARVVQAALQVGQGADHGLQGFFFATQFLGVLRIVPDVRAFQFGVDDMQAFGLGIVVKDTSGAGPDARRNRRCGR